MSGNYLNRGLQMKRFIAFIVCLTVCLSLFTFSVSAVSYWDGTTDTDWSGNGTASSPYLITSAAEFAGMAEKINTYYSSPYDTAYYKLTVDLNLSSFDWKPIGTSGYKFKGVFDGDGHTISNYRLASQTYGNAVFGYIYNATVKNVKTSSSSRLPTPLIYSAEKSKIINIENTADIYNEKTPTAGICSKAKSTSFSNCINSGNIQAPNNFSGGIVEELDGGEISYCSNSGSVSGSSAGGIAAFLMYSVTLENCHNSGRINASKLRAGGIVGSTTNTGSSSKIYRCYNLGSVTSEKGCAGGICGAFPPKNISECYNTGDVTGYEKAGGIVGSSSYITIENCYNAGYIRSTNDYCGGISGSGDVYVYYCHNIGRVVSNYSKSGAMCGPYRSVLSYCYWLSGSADLGDCDTTKDVVGKIEEKSAAQFMNESTFSGWNFSSIWAMGSKYPILRFSSIKISGSVAVKGVPSPGKTLTAETSGLTPSGANIAYRWYKNGTVVSGRTSSYYTVTSDDLGSYISVEIYGLGKYYGKLTSKSVYVVPIKVSGVELTPTELTLSLGEGRRLSYTVLPTDATNKDVEWRSSDNSVVKVNYYGYITGMSVGTATVTVTTADGAFSAKCTVTVICKHKNIKNVPAEKSTCVKAGHAEYSECSDCGELLSGSKEPLDLADHTFEQIVSSKTLISAATCVSPAVYFKSCSVCGKVSEETFTFGLSDDTNHLPSADWTFDGESHWKTCLRDGCDARLEEHEHFGGEATCVEQAICEVCGTHYGEINSENHIVSEEWFFDGESHWKTCQRDGCNARLKEHAHFGGEATCVEQAICEVCGTHYGETAPENHQPSEEWTFDGESHWKTCQRDGCNARLEEHAHFGGEATCVEQAICEVCGTHYGETAPENYQPSEEWTFDGESHWKTCQRDGCNARIEENAHFGGEATCVEQAICEVCGTHYGDIDPENHIVSEEWSSDGENHWKTCLRDGCDARLEEHAHFGGEATCVEQAICEVCGTHYGDIDPENHIVSDEWTFDGESHWKTCQRDGCVARLEEKAHFGGEATCVEQAICEVCGTHYGDVAPENHQQSEEWTFNEESHWKTCQRDGCNARIEENAHFGGEATCIEQAICEVCGIHYGDTDSDRHHGHTYTVGAYPAAPGVPGYTGDVYCSDCHHKVSDGQILPALPLKGDINNDGTVDIVDAMLLFYHVAKKELLSEDELSRGDLDGDGFIDISDAMLLFYFVAKKITEL